MNKLELAQKAISAIEKAMPSVKIYNLWKWEKDHSIKRMWSGSFKFDNIMWGGYAKWRIIEVYGAESSWKTTMCLVAAAEVTKNGGVVAFIDAEQALDTEYAKKIGVNMDNFFLVQPGYGEEAFNLLDGFVRSGAFDLIIVDSVSALTPKSVLEGDAEDAAQIWVLARLMSKNLSRTVPILGQNGDTVVIFINQERMKIWGFTMWYGDPVETTWGKALKFYSSIRVEVKKGEPINRWDDRIWNVVRLKTVKNKTAAPFQKTEIRVMFDEAMNKWWVDADQEIIDIVIDREMLGARGRYLSPSGEAIKSGEANGIKLDGKEMLSYYLGQPENKEQLDYLKAKVNKADFTIERDKDNKATDYKGKKTTKVEKETDSTVEDKTSEE